MAGARKKNQIGQWPNVGGAAAEVIAREPLYNPS